MDIHETIAKNLSDWMKGPPELTIKQLAAKSGVGFGTVRRAKNADGNITIQNLEAIAGAFGRKATDLLVPPPDYGTRPTPEQHKVAEAAGAGYSVDSDIAALHVAIERLTPAAARVLLPVVTHIADSQPRSTGRRRSTPIDMSPADTAAPASATGSR